MGSKADESLFEKTPLIHDQSLKFLDGGQWKTWLEAMGYTGVNPDKGAHFNHADYCIEAAVDGGGIVLGRLGFAFREINAGRLIAPFKQAISAKGGFYFCCPHEALEKEKVLNFLAWLRDEASDQAIKRKLSRNLWKVGFCWKGKITKSVLAQCLYGKNFHADNNYSRLLPIRI